MATNRTIKSLKCKECGNSKLLLAGVYATWSQATQELVADKEADIEETNTFFCREDSGGCGVWMDANDSLVIEYE